MSSFVEYEHPEPQQFGGALPEPCTAEDAAALILPIPFDRTTSYVNGTKYGPAALLAACAALAPAQTRPSPLKVAFVYVSPVGAAGWSFQHDQGRRAMAAALGAQVSTTVVESVAEGADAERVMRDLAAQGHGLILDHIRAILIDEAIHDHRLHQHPAIGYC